MIRAPAPLRTDNTAHCPLHCPVPTALPMAHCTTQCTAQFSAHMHCPMYCPLPTVLSTALPTAMLPITPPALPTAHKSIGASTSVSCRVHNGTLRDPPGVLKGFHEGSTRGPFWDSAGGPCGFFNVSKKGRPRLLWRATVGIYVKIYILC